MFAAITPATWGLLGAFCYAGPRLVTCAIKARDEARGWWFCGLDFIVAIIIGAIAAAAFGTVALTFLHLSDHNAASAFVGWVANGVDAGAILGKLIGGRATRAIDEDKDR